MLLLDIISMRCSSLRFHTCDSVTQSKTPSSSRTVPQTFSLVIVSFSTLSTFKSYKNEMNWTEHTCSSCTASKWCPLVRLPRWDPRPRPQSPWPCHRRHLWVTNISRRKKCQWQKVYTAAARCLYNNCNKRLTDERIKVKRKREKNVSMPGCLTPHSDQLGSSALTDTGFFFFFFLKDISCKQIYSTQRPTEQINLLPFRESAFSSDTEIRYEIKLNFKGNSKTERGCDWAHHQTVVLENKQKEL